LVPVKSFTTREDAEAFAAGRNVPGDTALKKAKGPDKFYAVARGSRPGIYMEWADCSEAIEGAKGAKYKKFNTRAEAEDFIRLNGTAETVLGMGLAGADEETDAATDEEENQGGDEEGEVKPDVNVKKLLDAGVKVVAPSEVLPAGLGPDGVLRIYTDGSSRGNGKVGASAGVGVYFGQDDDR
jgi:ribonuclease HI